jgi:hypothetical protein
MDVKEAVAKAKGHIADLFRDEGITNIGFEEIVPDPNSDPDDPNFVWHITIGFSRTWDSQGAFGVAIGFPRGRTYKIVDISGKDGEIISVRNRAMADH